MLLDVVPFLSVEVSLGLEVYVVIPYISCTRTQYDDKVNVLRIETE